MGTPWFSDWAQRPGSEQISLLFVVLFGVLLAVTAAATVWWVRTADEARRPERRAQAKRDLRAVWVGTTLFWLAWISGAFGATLLVAALSFLVLREFITLTHTRRADHRSLILAFFAVLPLQYLLVGLRAFDLFTVFIPVYVFAAIPMVNALAGDPNRFLERTAKLQWGISVCIYGLSHLPALLLLQLPEFKDRGAFLLFVLVVTTMGAQMAQEAASRWFRRRPVARQIDRSFSFRAWGVGIAAAALLGAGLWWITPFAPWQLAPLCALAAAAGGLGELVMRALKKDAGVRHWGNRPSVTGAVGLLDRVAPLCFAAPIFFHSVRWYLSR